MYQAGLPDINGARPMKLKFYKDKVELTYTDKIFPKTFTIARQDIVELDLKVEDVNTTSKAITGAIIGNMLAGSLGVLAMAGQAGNQSKQDFLHLVINYKGENRPLVLQTSKNTQQIYQLLKQIKS